MDVWQGMFRKRGRPPEQLQVGGYDQPLLVEHSTPLPVHQSLVPFEGLKQLPLQPARELAQDVVMENSNDAGSNQQQPNQMVSDRPRQDDMLAFDPEQIEIDFSAFSPERVPCDKMSL